MKTRYDIGDHVLIEAVIESITIRDIGILYIVRTEKAKGDWGPASLVTKEEDVKQKPDEFNGCDNCKYDHVLMTAYPCSDCEHNHISHYEPKEVEDLSEE